MKHIDAIYGHSLTLTPMCKSCGIHLKLHIGRTYKCPPKGK